MKNLFACLCFAVVFLTGCGSEYDDSIFGQKKGAFTAEEINLIKAYNNVTSTQSGDIFEFYEPMGNMIASVRYSGIKDNHYTYNPPRDLSKPFCEATSIVRGLESGNMEAALGIKIDHKFSEFYAKAMGFQLESCDDNKVSSDTVSDSRYKVTTNSETVKLSPEMYDELYKAVTTCKRAELAAINGFEPNKVLSQKDYEKAMNIILDCKTYQLEKALNEK